MKKAFLFFLLVCATAQTQQITVNNVQSSAKQGNSTRFQLAGSITNTAGLGICTDANGNTTTASCPSYQPPISAGTIYQYYRGDKTFVTLDTSVVPENGNLYFTPARAIAQFSGVTPIYVGSNGAISCTTCLVSGVVYTDPSWLYLTWGGGHITGIPSYQPLITAGTTSQYFRGDESWQTLNTSIIPEGSNLYFTSSRALATFSASGQLVYNATTGVFSIPPVELAVAAGTSAQYYRGDKTWQTLNSDAVPEGVTNLYHTTARVLAAISGASPIVDTAGAFSCPSCLTTTGGQTVGGTETFNNVIINGTCTGSGCGSGGSGTPGGTSGQVEWNNAGSFGGFTMSGDATLVTSTGVLTLATASTTYGTCGDSTHSCQITTNAKGLVTAQASVGIAGGGGTTPGGTNGQIQYNLTGSFAGLTVSGDFTLATSGVGTLATVNSGPGSCGDATHVCEITTNGKGLVTTQSAVAITGSGSPGGSSGQLQYNNGGAFGGFTAGGDLTFSQPNFTLATVNTNTGACGDTTHYPVVTLNAKGLVTACSVQSVPSLSNTPLLTASNTYTSGSSVNTWQGSNGYVSISTATNALIGAYAGTGATASAFYFSATASTTPGIDIQVGSTIYSGATASGCSSFVAGICVASGSAGGTVYSIATSGPISGGTITTSGTISCPSCLTTAGGWTAAGANTFSGGVSFNNALSTVSVTGQLTVGRFTSITAAYQDESVLGLYGYQGGSQDLFNVYNYPGGVEEFWINHNGALGLQYYISYYNNLATAGAGVPPIYAIYTATGLTSSLGATSLQCGGTTCPVGFYRVTVYMTLNSGTGTVYQTVMWTDTRGANSYNFNYLPNGSNSFSGQPYNIYSNGAAIQISTTVAGTVNYNIYATLERLL